MLFPDHPYLEPRHFVDEKAVNENHKDYMFLECILFITEVRARGCGRSASRLRAGRKEVDKPELLPKGGGLAAGGGFLQGSLSGNLNSF